MAYPRACLFYLCHYPGLFEPAHCLSYLVVEIEVERAILVSASIFEIVVAIYAPVIVLRQSFCLGLQLRVPSVWRHLHTSLAGVMLKPHELERIGRPSCRQGVPD